MKKNKKLLSVQVSSIVRDNKIEIDCVDYNDCACVLHDNASVIVW